MRINKFFTDRGICSRREADRIIQAGRVSIGGRRAVLGDQVQEGDEVLLDGQRVGTGEKVPLVLAYNKPVGVVCTSDMKDPNNIIDALNYPERVFHIGRLDQMSEGLILFTNLGDIVNRILRSRFANEKEYLVEVDGPLSDDDLRDLAAGVELEGRRTLPCRIDRVGSRRVKMILTEGRNRQIRRMMEFVGRKVTRLKRIRIMDIELGTLAVGKWRELSPVEMKNLMGSLASTAE